MNGNEHLNADETAAAAKDAATEETAKESEETEIAPEDDGYDATTTAAARIANIKKQLQSCKKERAEYLAGWQRAKADLINARKEEERMRMIFAARANVQLMQALLPLADSLDAAQRHADEQSELGKGLSGIMQQLQYIFQMHGVAAFSAKRGEQFDPHLHEAIETVTAAPPEEDGKILAELQTGYKIGSEVLRPARVRVSRHIPNEGNK